ncbi:N-acetyltransferase [Candidatus Woesearchaeota archaeon]|nr:MAG: N-acetyltransferase [Candidatus Woesearchaeota archaeon]
MVWYFAVTRGFLMTLELVVDEELQLKEFRPEDAAAIFNLIDRNRAHLSQHGDDTAQKYPTETVVYESIVHPKNPQRKRFGMWSEDTLVGSINLTLEGHSAEIGYYLGSEFQGKKYMTRSVRRIVSYGFDELGLKRIYAKVHVQNMASRAVLMAAGFSFITLKGESAIYVQNRNITTT